MGKEEIDDVSVSVHSVDGPWTPNRSRTWGNDFVQTRNKSLKWTWIWGLRNRCTSACTTADQMARSAFRSTERVMQPASSAVRSFMRNHLWPMFIRVFTAKKQWIALVLFLCCAVVPMVALGYFTPRPETDFGTWPPYYNVFAAKQMSCGNQNIDYYPANITVTGIEGLFVLDQTWGRFLFSTAKTIDVAWDIVVGRGVQILAWWAAYVVFSDALLRVIERHAASFRIFQRIALEGPSLLSLWTLCKELLAVKSKRTRTLFAYMLVSTSYVLSIPMFLGAMTGYDSTAIPWIDLDNSNNIVPASALTNAWVISGTMNSTWKPKVCSDPDNAMIQGNYFHGRVQHCSCQMPNGTIAPPGTFYYTNSSALHPIELTDERLTTCLFNYQGSKGTWEENEYDAHNGGAWKRVTHVCNDTMTLEVNGKDYDIQNLNGTYTLCYNNEAYDKWSLQGRSRCLPDTANPSYQWGFSTMLSGIFVFVHFGWCVSMYVVWEDAQARSTLVQEGYEMTPLRAAFVIAKAAERKTGLGEKQLIRRDTRELNKELYGSGTKRGTKIDYSIFVTNVAENTQDDRRVGRRRGLAMDGLQS